MSPETLKIHPNFWIHKSAGFSCGSAVAQLVERLTVNQVVVGSNPTRGAILPPRYNAYNGYYNET